MNEAESTPSPNRFWRKFGIRSAALNAPAGPELPRKCAKTCSRARPARRESRIPAATRSEWTPDEERERGNGRGSREAAGACGLSYLLLGLRDLRRRLA